MPSQNPEGEQPDTTETQQFTHMGADITMTYSAVTPMGVHSARRRPLDRRSRDRGHYLYCCHTRTGLHDKQSIEIPLSLAF